MLNWLHRKLDGLLTTEQFAYPELKSMFWTLALDSFFIFSIGMLSTALVSSVGEAAIAAVSMVGTINGMVREKHPTYNCVITIDQSYVSSK